MTEVLITGAGGFIGSWVCQKFVERGFKVRALCRYTSSNSIGWLENYKYKNEIRFFFGDIVDKNVAKKAVPEMTKTWPLIGNHSLSSRILCKYKYLWIFKLFK